MDKVTRIFNPDNPLDENIEKYKVILTHTPADIMGVANTTRANGVYKFQVPPLQSNTNDNNYNQCFITTRKIVVDPMSINLVGKRNPNPIWRCLVDPIAPGGVATDFAMGTLIAEFSVPSRNQGLIQEIGDDASISQQNILYKYQELCYFDIKYKQNYQGLSQYSPTSIKDDIVSNVTALDLGYREFVDKDSDVGMPVTPAFNISGGTDILIKNLWTNQKSDGSGTITSVAGGGGHTYGLTGNSVLFAYEPKNPITCLCANPFGSELTLQFRDALTGASPVMLEDAATAGTDIGCVSVELEITMVKNRPAGR